MRQNEVNHVIKLFVVAHKQCELTLGLKCFWSTIENFDTFVAEAEHTVFSNYEHPKKGTF